MKKCINSFCLFLCTCFLVYGHTVKAEVTDFCSSITHLECTIGDDGRRTYDFEIHFCDGFGAFDFLDISSQQGIVYDVEYSPRPFPAPFGEYNITGTFEPAPGINSFCIDITIDNGAVGPQIRTISLCGTLPDCPCTIANEIVDWPGCIRKDEVFCVQYRFDYYGEDKLPIEWVVSGSGMELVSATNKVNPSSDLVRVGPNVWELCFRDTSNCSGSDQVPFAFWGTTEGTDCGFGQHILLPCCECIPLSPVVTFGNCVTEGEARIYEFSILLNGGAAIGDSFTVSIPSQVGWISSPVGEIINGRDFLISGRIIVLSTATSEVCFTLDIDNPTFCPVDDICADLPNCTACYDHLVVDAPDCVEPGGQNFCVTYAFDYFGPPTTGVSISWYQLPFTPATVQLLSPINQTPGADADEVVVGRNVWELCFAYDPGEGSCEGPIPLGIRAAMFTSEGLQCCSFRDVRKLECCCELPEIDFQWCGVQGEQLRLVRQLLESEEAYSGAKMDFGMLTDGLQGCDGEEGGTHSESCCFICEDGVGPIFALDAATQATFPKPPYTYQWEGDAIVGPTDGPFIIGKPGVTYTVTVTNTEEENCRTVASITVECTEEEGQPQQGPFLIQWQDQPIQGLHIFPNPSSDQLRLQGEMIQEGVQLQLINLTGQQVLTQEVLDQGQMRVNVTELPMGTYFVRLQDTEGRLLTSQRIVIMR